jgi:MarR-like DNA-binding transcriptional regulator SgrR of sgrS sRNA
VRIPAPAQLHRLEPGGALTPFEAAVSAAIFDPLYRIDDRGEVVPHLAAGLPEALSARRYRISLRADVRRHDRRLLQPRDVARSLRRAAAGPSGWLLAGFARRDGRLVVDVGDGAIILAVTEPELDVARRLAAPALAIVARRSPPVGTGPFRIRRRGDEWHLTAFRGTSGPAPYLERIELAAPRSRVAELRAFELGRVDASWHGASVYGSRPARPVTASPVSAYPVLLVPNSDGSPLSDRATFAAVVRAIDRSRLERTGLRPALRLADDLPSPELGTPSSLPESLSLQLVVDRSSAFEAQLAEALAGVLDEAGIGLVVRGVAPERVLPVWRRGRYDLRFGTVVPQVVSRAGLLASALAATGERDAAARALGIASPPDLESAAKRLGAAVLGTRNAVLHHRSDLSGISFGPTGLLQLARLHVSRTPDGQQP